jgi:hypothetical protein
MAVRVKARSSALYEEDLYAWSEAQAELLRRRRFSELDLEHVVAETLDVGGSLYREVRSPPTDADGDSQGLMDHPKKRLADHGLTSR